MSTTDTAWIVYCETHRHYLVHASSGGTTWSDDQSNARRYDTKIAARKAADAATWLDHRPIPWAVASLRRVTVQLSASRHALDWLNRYDGDDAEALIVRPRSALLDLSRDALRDLIADAVYYAEEMSPNNTGDHDYRPAARACLRALSRAGVRWTRRPGTFVITLDS